MAVHHDDVAYLSAEQLLAGYRAGELSPVEVTEALLERVDQATPALNAIVTVTGEIARAQAREAEAAYREGRSDGRPLLGVPFTVKDNIAVKGASARRWGRCSASTSSRTSSRPPSSAASPPARSCSARRTRRSTAGRARRRTACSGRRTTRGTSS